LQKLAHWADGKPDDGSPTTPPVASGGAAEVDAHAPAKQAGASAPEPGAPAHSDGARPLDSEEKLAAQQWLGRIPDDPGGLLRRKFLYQYRQRAQQSGTGSD
jgi:Ca-activated chloride channel family protein